MNTVQLDQACNSGHLVKACAAEGKVTALRLPAKLVNANDPEVLAELIPKGNPILTLDFELAFEHCNCIPDKHPGILGVNLDHDEIKTMTTHECQRMLHALKGEVEKWNELDPSNSVVLIRKSTIEVSHCQANEIVFDGMVKRTTDGWQDRFTAMLAKNAALP